MLEYSFFFVIGPNKLAPSIIDRFFLETLEIGHEVFSIGY
jgi:hypothetical protein